VGVDLLQEEVPWVVVQVVVVVERVPVPILVQWLCWCAGGSSDDDELHTRGPSLRPPKPAGVLWSSSLARAQAASMSATVGLWSVLWPASSCLVAEGIGILVP